MTAKGFIRFVASTSLLGLLGAGACGGTEADVDGTSDGADASVADADFVGDAPPAADDVDASEPDEDIDSSTGVTDAGTDVGPTCYEENDCGGDGETACTSDQCSPACGAGLTNRGGTCTSLACHAFYDCGGDDQGVCTLDECAQPCRSGLTNRGARADLTCKRSTVWRRHQGRASDKCAGDNQV